MQRKKETNRETLRQIALLTVERYKESQRNRERVIIWPKKRERKMKKKQKEKTKK